MNEITVTMPLSEYEAIRARIEKLEREHVSRFVEMSYPTREHLIKGELVIKVNSEDIMEFMNPGDVNLNRLARIAKQANVREL